MRTKKTMCTWQILSNSPNNFHWQRITTTTTHQHASPPSFPLPSMQDLLRQGTPTLPLQDDAVARGEERVLDDGFGFSNSLFTTGSGKKVTISSSGLVRAKTLLDTIDSSIQSPHRTNKLHAIGEKRKQRQEEEDESPQLKLHRVIDSPSVGGGCRALKKNGFEETDAYKQAPIKFHTAGGRSISISKDALQRAQSLLGDVGDLFEGGDAGSSMFSFPFERQADTAASSQRGDCNTPLVRRVLTPARSNCTAKSFTFPLQSSRQRELPPKFPCEGDGNNLITEFDAVGEESGYNSLKSTNACGQKKPLYGWNQAPHSAVHDSSLNGFSSKIDTHAVSIRRPLVDVSNTTNPDQTNNRQPASGKRRLGLRVTVSPFKKPRSSQISVPLEQDIGKSPHDLSQLSSGVSGCKREVSIRYPFQYPRMHIKDFFVVPPLQEKAHFPNLSRQVTSVNAEKYVFYERSGDNGMGAEAFVHLLAHHGASMHFATKEWVTNHYKWIVWKLACYERYYPASSAGKFLTVTNVLEELKYRYEREVNHGHRSTIKKILEGDAPPSSMMILCISSICSSHATESGTCFETQNGTQKAAAVKVELTDGWYLMNAILDVPLSKQHAAGRLFVGQKLRISRAGLCGWNGPVSPLEVSSTVSLLLHINGTYRAHWAERLGFCKIAGPPLAFRCIKSNGGLVPQTLAGITRIYPILYMERLSSGRSVVMSERMENKMMELYNQRRSAVVDGIISEYQKERPHIYYDSDSEGAKIYNMLETAEEPEFLMADMSPEQLNSFATYKAKLNAIRQSEMDKSIEKALKDAGLGSRQVTPFMRLRVVGLTYKTRQDKPKEGIVAIWNPTETQRQELVEGGAYAISGLMPSSSDSDILHLDTRGSSTKWLPLSYNSRKQFKPFFCNRKSIPLTSLGDIPLSNEFDITAYVVHVGGVYISNQQKKQWVFATDGSIMNGLQSEKLIDSLLAICFCSPLIDHDSFPPINYNLAGSTVGFCNLIKKEKDHTNHIWVADANENSAYYLNFDSTNCSHLRNAASSVRAWANHSSLIIEKLKEKVMYVVGEDCKA
ncbi:protein BREAST CANCER SUSCEPTIBILITY 2 homolog B-like [Glycine soja]|uniref:Protein BREAST CANCER SUSCEPTIBILITY 2-like B n=1 Tax=Glycine soja TaxID=3848 RepID=A0A445H9W1_GLYSO|nr:protein BREAST CANCER SUSCEPTIBILITY 2 homolog B-like [Glycine soja]RZB70529.1 Protein BREAST CANCER SUSCEPTIBILITY 2-like B [Glycine soja]